ncbi:arginase [Arsukibacterium sp. MJ3]|uniref:formimidoylglutamase n=1 Tax=Arsukibacterium sp. MJ3 TaxID=1632859 RepID=UPI000626F722|nr:formimidoylglutamase [Arsukibacterium sp. MJ3]KKO49666.1 arginase [Arsukibacterium sp. MJ3]
MLQRFSTAELNHYCQPRPGETRLGQLVQLPDVKLPYPELLAQHKAAGGQFVLLGIAESIGPRANLGLAGAELGWQAFLQRFLNLQHNDSIATSTILLLGQIDCADLQQQAATLSNQQPAHLSRLRQLCSELDQRVSAQIVPIFAAGLYPIVIGGGHNNAYPLLQALAEVSKQPVNCANLDPHADFRPLEGRHSGNGFSYASKAGYLGHYTVLGLDLQKNSAQSLVLLQQAGGHYISYQHMFIQQQCSFQQALDKTIALSCQASADIAIELDTDSIQAMPASALNYSGISVAQAAQFVFQLARLPRARYLHLAEAAPACHPAGLDAGLKQCGQVLATLVLAFISGKTIQPATSLTSTPQAD